MKRRLLLSVIILLTSISGNLFAIDNKYEKYFSFSITPQFDITSGVIKEYVFEPLCENTDNIESRLDWNLKTIALFGLQTDFTILRYISLGLNGGVAVPQRSDFMQDYDWLNSVTNKWKDDDPTELTNFSEHVNSLNKFMTFSLNLGGNIYLPAEIKLTPYIAYQYEYIRFTGTNGYSKYKSNNFEIKSFSGNVISYEQEFISFLLGLGIKVDSIPHVSIKYTFDISPKLTTLNAIDYHYNRNTAFRDCFKNLLLINSQLIAQYTFTKNHKAGFSGKIQYIPRSKGITYSRTIDREGNFIDNSEWSLINNSFGGTERFIWSIGLNYSFSL